MSKIIKKTDKLAIVAEDNPNDMYIFKGLTLKEAMLYHEQNIGQLFQVHDDGSESALTHTRDIANLYVLGEVAYVDVGRMQFAELSFSNRYTDKQLKEALDKADKDNTFNDMDFIGVWNTSDKGERPLSAQIAEHLLSKDTEKSYPEHTYKRIPKHLSKDKDTFPLMFKGPEYKEPLKDNRPEDITDILSSPIKNMRSDTDNKYSDEECVMADVTDERASKLAVRESVSSFTSGSSGPNVVIEDSPSPEISNKSISNLKKILTEIKADRSNTNGYANKIFTNIKTIWGDRSVPWQRTRQTISEGDELPVVYDWRNTTTCNELFITQCNKSVDELDDSDEVKIILKLFLQATDDSKLEFIALTSFSVTFTAPSLYDHIKRLVAADFIPRYSLDTLLVSEGIMSPAIPLAVIKNVLQGGHPYKTGHSDIIHCLHEIKRYDKNPTVNYFVSMLVKCPRPIIDSFLSITGYEEEVNFLNMSRHLHGLDKTNRLDIYSLTLKDYIRNAIGGRSYR